LEGCERGRLQNVCTVIRGEGEQGDHEEDGSAERGMCMGHAKGLHRVYKGALVWIMQSC